MALTQTDAVIDFGHTADRVTIKAKLDAVPSSTSLADFTIRVIIVDNRTGAQHDSGAQPPTVVR